MGLILGQFELTSEEKTVYWNALLQGDMVAWVMTIGGCLVLAALLLWDRQRRSRKSRQAALNTSRAGPNEALQQTGHANENS